MCSANTYTIERLWAAAATLALHELERPNKTKKNDADWREWFMSKDLRKPLNAAQDEILRNFLTAYQLPRYFGRDGSPSPGDVFFFAKEATGGWRDCGLSDKAHLLIGELPGRCYDKARQKVQKKGPESAVSKLAWFFSPERWTLFDSRAASAWGNKSFLGFFSDLETKGFDCFCDIADREIAAIRPSKADNSDRLYGSRVLDKALYILGGIDNYKWLALFDSSEIHKKMPAKVREEVQGLGCEIGKSISTELQKSKNGIIEHLKARFCLQ